MRKTVWVSEEQDKRRLAAGASMAEVIEAGLRALEGEGPLRQLSPELRASVAVTVRLLEAVAAGKLAVVQDQQVPAKTEVTSA